MKTTVAELLAELEALAPLQYQESYDNSGLLVGNKSMEVSNVLLSLDCLEQTVQEAIEKKCNVILCHHPILFKGLKTLTGSNYVERTLISAVKNDIAIIAWHTNLDNVFKGGVNEKMANKLELENIQILNPKKKTLLKLVTYLPEADYDKVTHALFEIGCGSIGNYNNCSFNIIGEGTFKPAEGADPKVGKVDELSKGHEIRFEVLVPEPLRHLAIKTLQENHSYEEVAYELYQIENVNQEVGSGVIGNLKTPMSQEDFLRHCKESFGLEMLRYTQKRTKLISKVAVCGGSGSFLINHAKLMGADVFVTSDIKYHEFFDGESELMLCDIGHYESEISTLEIFHDVLSKKFTNFATLFTHINTNPVKYYI